MQVSSDYLIVFRSMLTHAYRHARHFGAAALLLTAALLAPAHAHEVWIEDTPEGGLMIRFAEYGGNFEKSPGALDSLLLPFAWTPPADAPVEASPAASSGNREARDIRAGKVQTIEVRKQGEGFLLVDAKAAQPAQIETGFTVMGQQGDPEKPARKPYFYARWQPPGTPAKPGLNFDIVPTEKQGEARVYFRGQPMPNVKLTLYPPAEKEQELTSDAEGLVRFSTTKPGVYLLAGARHRESISGFYGGKGYDVTSHNCSLCWRQP